MKPLFDKIVVLRDVAPNVTEAGLALSSVEIKNTGVIVAVGEGRLIHRNHIMTNNEVTFCHIEPLRVKVGDKVMFSRFAGTGFAGAGEYEKGELLVMTEDDVLIVL